jgi:copper chaperone CopZ
MIRSFIKHIVMKRLMTIFGWLIVLATLPSIVSAQVSKVTIQASGLTCSMCSNAIRKSLKSLDFVKGVEANIKNSTFEMSFVEGKGVDYDKIRIAVEDAGFFVARFQAVVKFNKVEAAHDSHLVVDGRNYHFVNIKKQVLDGEQTVRLIDKGFVSGKEFKKNKGLTKMGCYQTGMLDECCTAKGVSPNPSGTTRIFHVTI